MPRYISFCGLLVLLLFCPLKAAAVDSEPLLICPDAVEEGQAFMIRITWDRSFQSATVTWLSREVRLVPEQTASGWEAMAVLGLGMREQLEGAAFPLQVLVDDGGSPRLLTARVERVPVAFPEQRLNVDSSYVDISEENLARHRREKELFLQALNTISPEAMWTCPMQRPVPGVVTSPFGLRRFFNEQPRNPHSGVDLDGDQGEAVYAAFAGVVLLAEEFFFAGNCVYVDHGQGMVSMYLHLSQRLVAAGDIVEAGQVIGLVGQTGRVTGAHLHFGVVILGQKIDPLALQSVLCP